MARLTEFVGNHLYLFLAFFGLIIAIVVNELQRRTRGGNELSPMEATRMMNHQNALMLDVRETNEFADGHIVNALHVPLSDVGGNKKLEKYKDKPVIAYCRSGHRSAVACGKLRKQGFTSVYNLRGGVMAWQRENLPLTKQ